MDAHFTLTLGNIATLISIICTVLGLVFAGSWTLMKAMIFNPMMSLKREIQETNKQLRELGETISGTSSQVMVINQWRIDVERRLVHIEETI